eukprot:GILJ01009668.1.p1 GENE.GILJ01009668.1~~GILJ01009668.1.p1  ORF type:complete len:303 (-),score=38.10 GILJ01009668.1:17-925(-)
MFVVPSRAILKLVGADSLRVLHQLATNDVRVLQGNQDGIYSGFLNTKGRVLFDAFVIRSQSESEFALDCHADALETAVGHINKYKLRSKVKLTDVSSEYKVLHFTPSFSPDLSSVASTLKSLSASPSVFACQDSRLAQFGLRAVVPNSATLPSEFVSQPSNGYEALRISHGLPEGPVDLPIGEALPLNCNLDYLNAINFHKGCYLGQELTARTFYTGAIRRRLVIVEDTSGNTEPLGVPGADVTVEGDKVGVLHSVAGSRGLAMIRLDVFGKSTNPIVTIGERQVQLRLPSYLPETVVFDAL